MFKKHIVTILIITMLVVLSGCNKKNETTLEKIKDKGELSFAMTGAYPPFNYIDDDGNITGFDIEIANAIADKMGVKATPITTAWDGIIGGLTGSRFDLIIGSMAITDERLEQVNFTSPYYYDGAQFFAAPASALESINDLTNGKVGVVTGTTFYEFLSDMDNIDEILQFESDVDNFKSVEQGRIDGLVTGKFVGLEAPIKYDVDIEPVGALLYSEDIAIAVRKDDPELLDAVNKALDEIIEDGTYDEISDKYFGMNILEK